MGSGYVLTADDAGKFSLENEESLSYYDEDGKKLCLGEKKLLTDGMVGEISAQTYTGDAVTPALTVKDGDETLTKDTHFSVAWSNNVNAGTATVTLTGKGDYSGTVEKTFTINKAPVTVTAENKEKISGKNDPELTATVTGKPANGNEVVYTLSRAQGEEAGEYEITVSADESKNPNYTVTAVSGKLTVIAATYTLSVAAPTFAEVKDD